MNGTLELWFSGCCFALVLPLRLTWRNLFPAVRTPYERFGKVFPFALQRSRGTPATFVSRLSSFFLLLFSPMHFPVEQSPQDKRSRIAEPFFNDFLGETSHHGKD